MGDVTKIQWCDHTFNPWIGCTKVSPGCLHCYAEMSTRARVLRHRGQETWGKGAQRSRTSESNWKEPLRWNKAAGTWPGKCLKCGYLWERITADPNDLRCPRDGCDGTLTLVDARKRPYEPIQRPRVFCASLSDWLDDEVPIEWLADLLGVINDTPNLDWLLLTKRPENWHDRVKLAWETCRSAMDTNLRWLRGQAPLNVWVGTTIEDQERMQRHRDLMNIPARVHFWSAEPLLSALDVQAAWSTCGAPDWVIPGFESGSHSRTGNVAWIRNLVRDCAAAGVKCFVKQLGKSYHEDVGSQRRRVYNDDKKGGDMAEWPEDLRVREFPKVESGVLHD